MANKNLDFLLSEYDEKRRIAELKFEKLKEQVYKNYPRIEEIDLQINKLN